MHAESSAVQVKEVRKMSEAMITFLVMAIAVSAICGVVYESFYADRE